MDFLRQLILYGILIISFWGGIALMKSLSTIDVPMGYTDVREVPEFGTYRVDQTVRLSGFRADDAICFRLGADEDLAVNFGWVVGLPGDMIAVKNGQVLVNGSAAGHGDQITMSDCGPVQVPRDHLYILSDKHMRDSIAFGAFPASAIIGRVGALP